MTRFFIAVVFLVPLWVVGQEGVTTNIDENWSSGSVTERLLINDDDPCNFTYLHDTIFLPFIDDFSTDLRHQFDASETDPGVLDTLYYYLYRGGIPEPDTVQFRDNVAFHVYADTLADGSDTSWTDTIPSFTVSVCDMCTYPISCVDMELYYNFNIYDTIYLGTTDTLWFTPDYVQDTLRRYFIPHNDPLARWIDRNACVNYGFAVDPPTVGVATFDALDEYGYPYNFVNTSLYGEADYLTSYPIDMTFDTLLSSSIDEGDSLYLSFFYQAQGMGNQPESTDSLVLEFWSPTTSQWNWQWSVPGQSLDDFERVMIPITDPQYFARGFQFRFKNYGTLSGALDHWNIDYVILDIGRTYDDTLIDDFAFRYPPYSIIDTYTSMPWNHFMTDPSGYMRDTITTYSYNLGASTTILGTNGLHIDLDGSTINAFNHPNVPNVNPMSFDTPLHQITSDYAFVYDTALADTCITFNVKFWTATATYQDREENDTVYFDQHFGNYYAYDDGSAELGYFVNSTGSPAKLAQKFNSPIVDSVVGVRIYWLPVGESSASESFFLTVWDDSGGEPGTILSQNTTFSKPVYGLGKNAFAWYAFDDTVVAVSGNFHVGYQQTSNNPIIIGMDKNINNQDKIFYNTGSGWNNTSFEGSLLMRPVFAGDKYNLEMDVQEIDEPISFTMFPNPTSDWVSVVVNDDFNQLNVSVYDLSGRQVIGQQFTGVAQLDVSELQTGMYMLLITDGQNGRSATEKLVIQK